MKNQKENSKTHGKLCIYTSILRNDTSDEPLTLLEEAAHTNTLLTKS